jgi:hypothetical protein
MIGRLISVLVMLLLFVVADSVPRGPLKAACYVIAGVMAYAMIFLEVRRRRKAGQSWNEALAMGSKLVTGNVWLDGLLFAGILLLCAVAFVVAVFYL